MFVSTASEQFSLEQAAANPLQGEIQDFSLTYARSLDDGRMRLAADARQKSLVQAYDDYTDDIWHKTGERVSNPYRVSADSAAFADAIARDPEAMTKWEAERWAKFDGKVSDLASKFPGLTVKTRDDIQADIAERVRGVKDLAERDGINVGWAGLGRFAGYGQAAMEDPTNAVAMIFGGFGAGDAMATAAARATLASRLAPIGGTMLREGAANAVTEAVTQPQVKGFSNELGIEYGWDEVAANVAMAGAGGAVLGGGLHATGLGLKSLLGKWGAAKTAGHVVEDAETRAAAMVLRDVETMRRANPYPPGVEGDAAFAEADRAVIDALMKGGPLPAEALSRFDANQRTRIMEFADGDLSEGERASRRKPDAIHHSVARGERAEVLASQVKADLGKTVDFTDAVHRIDEDGVKHAMKHHAGDHLPLRRDDLARIPEAVRTGEVVKADLGKTGQIGIEYRVRVDDGWLHVHEELRKARSLAFITAYRRPDKTKPGHNGPGSDGPQRSPQTGWPSPGSPHPDNMRAAPVERKTLPPELKPPSGKPPETLVGFLKRMGGVKDTDGWLSHMGVDNSRRPGLIAGKGMDLDDAALRAWEDGFFPEFHDRPTPDHLRLQIAADLGPEGLDRVRGSDVGARLEWDAYNGMMDDLDRMGVDPYGKSWEEISASVDAYHAAEAESHRMFMEVALPKINPDAAQALSDEQAFIARIYGELLAEDVDIPTGLTDMDGRLDMVSARETMDAWDDEAMSWDSAIACFGKVS
ncbi:hypothetical protein [Magnetospirillum sulfuroxidans]|uniref:Phage-Barnase-EndoU-ColicinE5/D-RelE like nuclease 3 domain-containing protein n=1 Tax=Magnetospirillum sulfuroxidans TaxID=611300 RepID=A0ABS5I8S0_9PROT|nr:hypothetical protein [Magnetospirillum sulfuroxidans]MBR9970807.1 hypothetical protein [Magnetospirillum sulfuroxidans]